MKLNRPFFGIGYRNFIWLAIAGISMPIYSFSAKRVVDFLHEIIADDFESEAKTESKLETKKINIKSNVDAIPFLNPQDSSKNGGKDSSKKEDLKYPIDNPNNPNYKNNIDLLDPSVKKSISYNSTTKMYEEYKEVAGRKTLLRSLTRDEYMKESAQKEKKNYFDQKAKSNAGSSGYNNNKLPDLIKTPEVLDKVFRGGLIDIQPSGSAELTFGGNFNTVRNPQFSARQQKTGQFDFDQKIQLNVAGKIGNALNIGIKYDTDATFDFDNQTKLAWQGKEDQMLKNIELGNVSLPLNGSLIQAGQSLFGLKTDWQFGRLKMSAIATQNKGQRTETTVNGGAQVTKFNIQAHNYDQNRHFFMGQFFKDQYDNALSSLPIVQSGVFINRIEVWVTNKSGNFENTKDVLTVMDLGESNPYNTAANAPTAVSPLANNGANKIYQEFSTNSNVRNSKTTIDALNTSFPQYKQGLDYELLTYARQLNANEFTFNQRLGYLSLNSALNNDEILGIAYEYTYNGGVYKVGEFASESNGDRDNPQILVVKMLKNNIIRTKLPLWELMMKNIYSLGSFNINATDLDFNVIYNDDPSGADLNYMPLKDFPQMAGGIPIIRVLNMDRVNRQLEAKPDGVFDAVEDVTFQSKFGRVIFPVREPFGSFLRSKFDGNNSVADRYVFDALYDSTKWLAEQDVAHNKFFLKGTYKGTSSNEISLNALNVPQGSVVVTANGTKLTEGVDFVVDYNAGKVTIINQGILQSGATIRVSAESNSMFNIQQKTLLGARFDYAANKKLLLGGTVLHMYERALTPKTNINDDPLLNTILGFDFSYNSPSLFLTKLVDKLPFIQTKAESKISAQGEYARIFPGQALGQNKQRGVSYLDDFEGAETAFDLRLLSNWKLASIPQFNPTLFPEWINNTSAKFGWGFYRSKMAWYNIDPTFYRNDKYTPTHIKNDVNMQSNHYMREVTVNEVFPNRQIPQGAPNILPTFDLAFFPRERGIYNYNSNAGDFNAEGFFSNPENTWAGVMRRIESNDFEAANIDYIEIWMMDPFIYNNTGSNKGKLYIDLGNISEDILPDNRKFFENGISPVGNQRDMDTSLFGRVPILPQLNNAFDNEPSARERQDIGLDGMNDDDERSFYKNYLDGLKTNYGANSRIYLDALNDPSNDNYAHNRVPGYDGVQASIITRYKRFNNHQGNATINKLADGSPESATNMPDNEDINNDFTMNQTEDYFHYEIELNPNTMSIGNGFVTDINEINKTLKNGKTERIKWYQIKVPIREYQKAVGNISDFKSIRFMRMYMKGFSDSTILRFANLQLVRADWRRYLNTLNAPGAIVPVDPNDNTSFVISTVNVEENGKRTPIKYAVPPGINRVRDPASQNVVEQNEQSISLKACNLKPGDSRGAYKSLNFDIRNYKNFKMFAHAEGENLKDGDLSAFIRIGTDLVGNYYEYEIPLKITPNGSIAADRIWPTDNNFDFPLADLFNSKTKREDANGQFARLFSYINEKGHKVSILGLPDLSNVRTIMLGIKNNTDNPICGEVWFNEMRVTDISNKGGWAATSRVVAQMADFATLSASGNISTIGFGGIDKRLNERNLSNNYQFDLSSAFELGKFFPQKAGVNIPMFIGYSGTIARPKFNPLNPDIELKDAVARLAPDERDKVLKAAEDYNSRYSVNFTNVRKNRTGEGKIMPWSISNFNLTYSYIHVQKRNIQIEEHFSKTYHGSIGYNYSPQTKPIEPFKFIKSKKLALIKDINFNYLPQNITIRTDIDRFYSETQNRGNDLFKQITPKLFDKNFTTQRVYNVNFPITKSLKLDYSAIVNSRIQEPYGELKTPEQRDSVRKDFWAMGKMRDFNQIANFNYTLPFSKIGLLNWVSSSVKYGANYNWTQAPPAFSTFGNTISNSRELSSNNNFNFVNLYNKIPALRKINQGQGRKPSKPASATNPGSAETSKNKDSKEKVAVGTGLLKSLMMLKNGTINYTSRDGIILPGFKENIDYFGQNFAQGAPGFAFILGDQNDRIRYNLAQNNKLTNDIRLNNFYIQTSTKTIQGTATIEPFKDFKVQANFNLSRSSNIQSLFKYNDTTSRWEDFAITETGNFSMTSIFIKTARDNPNSKNNWQSNAFDNFENFRYVVSRRQVNADDRVVVKDIDTTNRGKYFSGYGPTAQNTMIPAFIAAYTGANQSKVSLSPFRNIPLPNWNVNYNGLSKIKAIGRYFSNITIQHRYSGNYNINGYTTNLFYNENAEVEGGKDLVSRINVQNVSIREQFSPLIGIDITTKKGLTANFKYNTSRNILLAVQNATVNEARSKEVTFNLSYRVSGIKLPVKFNGKKIFLENDLQITLDFSIRDNTTIIRKVDQELNVPGNGQRIVTINPKISYMVNKNINVDLFYDRKMSTPYVSTSFPTALTTFGMRMRYTIQ